MVMNSIADNDIAGLVNAKVPSVLKTGREKPHFHFYFSCWSYRTVAVWMYQM